MRGVGVVEASPSCLHISAPAPRRLTMTLESDPTEPRKPRRGDSTVDIPACSGESAEAPSGSDSERESKPPPPPAWRRAAACCRSARSLKAFTLAALCTAIVVTALFFAAGASRRGWGRRVAMRCCRTLGLGASAAYRSSSLVAAQLGTSEPTPRGFGRARAASRPPNLAAPAWRFPRLPTSRFPPLFSARRASKPSARLRAALQCRSDARRVGAQRRHRREGVHPAAQLHIRHLTRLACWRRCTQR